MSRLGVRARGYISDRIDYHAREIDGTVLQDRVFEADDGAPETLYHLATATEAACHAMDDRELSDPVRIGAGAAYDKANDALEQFIDELVAQECLDVIQYADEWAEEWDRDPEDFEEAKHEAREWLQAHTDAAKRAGVFEKLDASEQVAIQ